LTRTGLVSYGHTAEFVQGGAGLFGVRAHRRAARGVRSLERPVNALGLFRALVHHVGHNVQQLSHMGRVIHKEVGSVGGDDSGGGCG